MSSSLQVQVDLMAVAASSAPPRNMTLLQRWKSARNPRPPSGIPATSPTAGDDVNVAEHASPSKHDVLDTVQDKPLPAVPAIAIPARNPKRGDRVPVVAPLINSRPPTPAQAPPPPPPSPPISHNLVKIKNSRLRLPTLLIPPVLATNHFADARLSLFSLNDSLRDEALDDIDQLLNAIEKVQTSFTTPYQVHVEDDGIHHAWQFNNVENPHSWQDEDDCTLYTDQDEGAYTLQTDQDVHHGLNLEQHFPTEPLWAEHSHGDALLNLGLKDDRDPEDDSQHIHETKDDMHPSPESEDDFYAQERCMCPANSVDLDHTSELVDDAAVSVHMMIDALPLYIEEGAPLLDTAQSQHSSDGDPMDEQNDSASSYSLDNYYGSPHASSKQEETRRGQAAGTHTPQTSYSELVMLPYPSKRIDDDKADDDQYPRGDWHLSPNAETHQLNTTEDSPQPCTTETLNFSPYHCEITPEEATHHTRVLSWLMTQHDLLPPPPPSPPLCSSPHSPSQRLHPALSPSLLHCAEEQDRYALEAQLEIEDWVTEWTSSLQVSRLYHQALECM